MKKTLVSFFFILSFLSLTFFTFTHMAKAANWWDTFGEPQYGGSITLVAQGPGGTPSFDNYSFIGAETQFWLETLWTAVDWKLDRKIWPYLVNATPEKYFAGHLVEKWEWTDRLTLTMHIRKGVHWQNKPPVNGREFTANDVQAHYDRLLGTGGGYTEPAPMYLAMLPANIINVRAVDKYTAVAKFSKPSGSALISMMDPFALNAIEAPEWVALGGPPKPPEQSGPPKGGPPGAKKGPPPLPTGPLQDWKIAVGTGPWMVSNYISGTSLHFERNPDYWGFDERHPKNRLPYADELKILWIKDIATQLAALRTGKIDMMQSINWQQAETLSKSNPELQNTPIPAGCTAVGLKNDAKPFTDIRVRKALQLSIDRENIAKGYFGGTADGTPCGLVNPALVGYAYDYKDWPQKLKDEYSYNPDMAKKLLAEAGYPNGFKTNIVTSAMYDVPLYEVIKSYFLDIGVDMEIKLMDPGVLHSVINAGKFDQMVSWASGWIQYPSLLIGRFDSTNISVNFNHVRDPGYDKFIKEYNEASDPDEAARIVREADRYALEQHYVVNLFPTSVYTFWQPYLKGYSGEGQMVNWGGQYVFSRLWVDEELKKSMGR